jgi:hypothetical protein
MNGSTVVHLAGALKLMCQNAFSRYTVEILVANFMEEVRVAIFRWKIKKL